MHWPGGYLLLVGGIGFMAVYSTLLAISSVNAGPYNPEIIDSTED
jgi:hypothetical protein